MNHTTNYQLNQWDATDRVQRTDFNADNAKIDTAIAAVKAKADALETGKADADAFATLAAVVNQERIVVGSYTGNLLVGTLNPPERIISLPFTPKLLIISGYRTKNSDGTFFQFSICFGDTCFSFTDSACFPGGDVKIVSDGFRIAGVVHNIIGLQERYIAIR